MVTLVVLFLTLCLFYLRGKEGREREKDCRVNVENNIGLDIIRKFSLLLFLSRDIGWLCDCLGFNYIVRWLARCSNKGESTEGRNR